MTTVGYEAVPAVEGDAAAAPGNTLVMKFGGTSVGDTQKIKDVARRLVAAREAGQRVVGVLSAMGDTTDDLIRLAQEISPQPHPREYDMLVSVGERISNAFCAMAIRDLGHEAVSLTGSQAGIVTDTFHGKAKIVEVRARRLHAELDRDQIVLVAGFQGVSTDLEVTTLGRGGSDATAVALGVGARWSVRDLHRRRRRVHGRPTHRRRRAEAAEGSPTRRCSRWPRPARRVMMARSIEIARRYGVPLHVRSAFGDSEGTWIVKEENLVLEKAIISGVTHDTSEAKATVLAVPDRPGIAARIFRALADAGVNIDMIVQNVSAEGATDISFTLPKTDLPAAEPILEVLAAEIGAKGVVYDRGRREGVPRRRRHEEPSGCCRRHVRGAWRGRHQHRDHLDVRRSASRASCGRPTSSARCRRCTSGSAATPRSASVPEPRIAVVGATGAVGAVTLRLLRERGYRTRSRVRLFAVGRQEAWKAVSSSRRRRRRRSRPETSTSRSSPSARARHGSSCRMRFAVEPSRSTSRRPTACRTESRSSSRR